MIRVTDFFHKHMFFSCTDVQNTASYPVSVTSLRTQPTLVARNQSVASIQVLVNSLMPQPPRLHSQGLPMLLLLNPQDSQIPTHSQLQPCLKVCTTVNEIVHVCIHELRVKLREKSFANNFTQSSS